MKKIVIINGHPNPTSFNRAIAEAYKAGAEKSGAEVKEIVIGELSFSPNLQYGYQQRTVQEPDLVEAWQKILWADHLVWVHPVWWGGLPAVMKGFIDRVFLPGFAFRYRENSPWWDKLLKGKTAHIITTLDQPSWFYSIYFGKPSVNQLKKCTLAFCGVKTKKVTYFGPVKSAMAKQRGKWLKSVEAMAIAFQK